jgi:hypothetical protein
MLLYNRATGIKDQYVLCLLHVKLKLLIAYAYMLSELYQCRICARNKASAYINTGFFKTF